jgi:hypothetical protein
MQNGDRKEVSRLNALTLNGISTASVRLNESSIAGLEYGAPLFEPNKAITSRAGPDRYLASSTNKYPLGQTLRNLTFLNSINGGVLDPESLAKIPTTSFSGYFTNGSQSYILTNEGKRQVAVPSDLSEVYVSLSSDLVNAIPTSTPLNTTTSFLKASSSSTVYRVASRQKAPVASMQDIKLINPNYSIATIPDNYITQLTTIRIQYGPTRLIKSASSKSVYMIDGINSKRPVSNFSIISAKGLSTQVITAPESALDSYQNSSGGNVSHLVKCGDIYYLATGGLLRTISQDIRTEYGFENSEFVNYDSLTCAVLKKSGLFNARYVKPNNSRSIFYITGGFKREFRSLNSYYTHRQTSIAPDIIESSLAGLIPNGPLL